MPYSDDKALCDIEKIYDSGSSMVIPHPESLFKRVLSFQTTIGFLPEEIIGLFGERL